MATKVVTTTSISANAAQGSQMKQGPLTTGKGGAKDRTKDFLIIKNKITMYNNPAKRFEPTTNAIAFESFGGELGAGGQQNNKQGGLHPKKYAQLDEVGHGKNELPPLWVDIQESIEEKISKVDSQFEQLKALRAQRFKPKFDDSENHRLDSQIDQIVTSLTNVIKECERELRQMMQERYENDSDSQIRRNIQQTYLFKLQEVTRQLRQLEKEHLMRVKDLYGEEGEIILDQLEKKEGDYFASLEQENQQRELIQLDQFNEMSKQRSGDIERLVNQINELAVIFKELSILVIEQGTILDRIDYNIEAARTNVTKANVELKKTLKRETSFRARGCMSCLVTSILVCTGLLMMKHMM